MFLPLSPLPQFWGVPHSGQITGQKTNRRGFSSMPALREEWQGAQKSTDVILWPLFSKDLTLMDGRTNRRKRGREGKLQTAWLDQVITWGSQPGSVLALSPACLSLVCLYHTGKLNFSLSLFFSWLSSHTIPAGNSDIQKPNLFSKAQIV